MPLTITLHRVGDEQAEARVDEQLLATFNPLVLITNQPLHPSPRNTIDPYVYGYRLWESLGGRNLKGLLDPLPRAPNLKSLITISTDDPVLASIPWEYLHSGIRQDAFLVFDFLFMREVPNTNAPTAPSADVPWRLVAMGSDPLIDKMLDNEGNIKSYSRVPRLNIIGTLDDLQRNIERKLVAIRWQRIGPYINMLDSLDTNEPILFHYAGYWDKSNGASVLCLDDGTGCMERQPVAELAAHCRQRVYCMFLNTCHVADLTESGAHMVLALVQGGIPVVVNTHYCVLNDEQAAFAATFYHHLAFSIHPAQALYRARQKLQQHFPNDPILWGIPSLSMMEGYTWPLRESVAMPIEPVAETPINTLALQAPEQLLGREYTLVDLANLFVQKGRRVITIQGADGVGKSTLAYALAHQLRFFFTDGIYALSLKLSGEYPKLNVAVVRRMLAELLHIQHHPAFSQPATEPTSGFRQSDLPPMEGVEGTEPAHVVPEFGETHLLFRQAHLQPVAGVESVEHVEDMLTKEQEKALVEYVQGRTMLLLFDNYETVLWLLGRDRNQDEPAEQDTEQYAEAQAMQRLVKRLARAGCCMLFTSRQSPVRVRGETLYPRLREGHLPGLDEEGSIELFRLYGSTRVYGADFPVAVAREVEYNPLAIQLAATRWQTVQEGEAAFLHTLHDGLERARAAGMSEHRHIVTISMHLSMAVLPEALRQGLLTLSLIANPCITPTHAAVVWGMFERQNGEFLCDTQRAHTWLEQLRYGFLVKAVEHDAEHSTIREYALHPVIADGVLDVARSIDMDHARAWYAEWIEHMLLRSCNAECVSYDEHAIGEMRPILADIAAALHYLPDVRRGWAAWVAVHVFRTWGWIVESNRMLTLAKTIAQKMGDDRLLARVYYVEGMLVATAGGNTPVAQTRFGQAIALAEKRQDWHAQAAIVLHMAALQENCGDLTNAMYAYQQALRLYGELGDKHGRATTIARMAHVLELRGELGDAIHYYQQALELYEMLSIMAGKAAMLHAIALVLVLREGYVEALGYYQQALELRETLGDVRGKTETLYEMARALELRGDFVQAMRHYEQLLKSYETLGDWHGKARTLHNMAFALRRYGDFTQAMRYYRQALDLKENLGDVKGKAATLHNMAGLLVTRGNLTEAIAYYEQALALSEHLDDGRSRATTLFMLAQAELRAGNFESALAHADESKRVFQQMGATREVGQAQAVLDMIEESLHAGAGHFGNVANALSGRVASLMADVESVDTIETTTVTHEADAEDEQHLSLRQRIMHWRDAGCDAVQLEVLLDAIQAMALELLRAECTSCGIIVAKRWALAQDIAYLRAVYPLPIAGVHAFLHILQLLLRDEPGMRDAAQQIATHLPERFATLVEEVYQL